MMIGLAIMGLFLVGGLFPDQSVLTQVADLIKAHIQNIPKERWADTLADIQNFPDRFSPDLVSGIQSLLRDNWQSKLHLVSYEGTVNAERIVPAVILLSLPVGIRGFMLIAFVAAALSSFNASVNMTTGNSEHQPDLGLDHDGTWRRARHTIVDEVLLVAFQRWRICNRHDGGDRRRDCADRPVARPPRVAAVCACLHGIAHRDHSWNVPHRTDG
jgi:hypothetical protein